MFGTMSKPLQVGAAAESGLRAVLLARRGMSADLDVLGSAGGFRATQSEETGIPAEWSWASPAITEALFKYHAACYLTHSAIEGALKMRRSGLHHDEVQSIEVLVPAGHLQVCNIAEPATPLEGKFSLRFTTALALVEGDLTEQKFTTALIQDPAVTAVRDRVTVAARTDDSRSSMVRVTRTDGTELLEDVDVNRPTPVEDLGGRWDALVAKFHSLVDPLLGASAAERIVTEVTALPTSRSVQPLLDALCAGQAPFPGNGPYPRRK
jgi:2-methylcitrate dehydratase PrpD